MLTQHIDQQPPASQCLLAPFPYAGGKSAIAHQVWSLFGDVPNYVEPFCGSAAVLLARPHAPKIETINDLDGFIVNAYRSIQSDPDAVATWADWPVSECDLHARHAWLVTQREGLTRRLEGDPHYYEAKIAGWWLWGACCWIGSGWCEGRGPWQVVNGELVNLSNAGQGIHRKLPHLSNAGQGIHRKLPHLSNAGQGIAAYMTALAARLRGVRITCGPWSRVLGPSVTWRHGLTAILLDPPYRADEHGFGYAVGGESVWEACWQWAITHGNHPLLRIVLCGYDDGRPVPTGWRTWHWKARGGYGSQGQGRGRYNCQRETLYISPHCLEASEQLSLFTKDDGGPLSHS